MKTKLSNFMFLFLAVISVQVLSVIPKSERDALIALYNTTDGDNWTHTDNWNGAPGTECTWFGVTCNPEETHIIKIFIAQNGLTGPIPSCLSQQPGPTC